jgi:hypothetical protein
VTLDDALAVLGLTHSTNEDEARTRFRELMRQHHPDVSSSLNTPSGARVDPSRITHAYAIITEALQHSADGRLPSVPSSAATAERLNHDLGVACTHDGDTLWIEAPPDEAYQLLYEAASHLGGVGHVDRGLGLLEIIVRFDGGPSCSVLFTLQGRAHGTDVFCEMESIEAAPTPAISPVLDSLLEVLGSPQTPSAP